MQLELIGCDELERWYTRMDKGHSDLASIGVGKRKKWGKWLQTFL